ncbi:MAG: branched-chain-amino-acid transaminase [Thermoleophilia bacterium]
MQQIYIDGEFFGKEDAKISVFDHGLLYGDGVFEGIRVYRGRVFELDAHIDRLYDSALALALEVPLPRADLIEAMMETIRRNEVMDGYVRLVVTRGEGDLGLNPAKCGKSTVFCIAGGISLYPPEVYEKGFRVSTLATRRNDPQAINPAIKSLNYLNNILGALELRGSDVHEGLFLTSSGFVCECTADNVFLIKGRKLMTPSVALGALGGITRGVAMRLGRDMGLDVEEGFYTLYHVYTADEAFLTGSAAELGPIVEVDKRPIGAGVPGPLTTELIARFHEYALNSGTPVYPGN